jgi:hypothetical protein
MTMTDGETHIAGYSIDLRRLSKGDWIVVAILLLFPPAAFAYALGASIERLDADEEETDD